MRLFSENLTLKLISLIAAVVMWLYVNAERVPNTPITRIVNAEVVPVGEAPENLIVRLKATTIPATITGPKNEVDNIQDREVKAEFNISSIKPGVTTLTGRPFKAPPNAPDVTAAGRPTVDVQVLLKESKTLKVVAQISGGPSAESRYGQPRLSPESAVIRGAHDDLIRVTRLLALIEPSSSGLRADVPLKALDKDNVEVSGIEVEPAKVHVELMLTEAPATRTLIVNVPHRGQVAYPYQVVEITAVPDQVMVTGKSDLLLQMGSVSTEEVDLNGLVSDFTREVRLQPLPRGVTLADGRRSVQVTVRVRDTSKTTSTGP